ncbi:unnamed protein product [Amoebophrya sp. A120]|nr:unnamed protein product [Amoebophrya sp. A120]|eukprot:GSA120T00001740001.1
MKRGTTETNGKSGVDLGFPSAKRQKLSPCLTEPRKQKVGADTIAQLEECQAEIQALEERCAAEQIAKQLAQEDRKRPILIQRSLALRRIPYFWKHVFESLPMLVDSTSLGRAKNGSTGGISGRIRGPALGSIQTTTATSPSASNKGTSVNKATHQMTNVGSSSSSSSSAANPLLRAGKMNATNSAATGPTRPHGLAVSNLPVMTPAPQLFKFSDQEAELFSFLTEVYLQDNEDENGSHTFRFEFTANPFLSSVPAGSSSNGGPTATSPKFDFANKRLSTSPGGGTAAKLTGTATSGASPRSARENKQVELSSFLSPRSATNKKASTTSPRGPIVVVEKHVAVGDDNVRTVTTSKFQWNTPVTGPFADWLAGSSEARHQEPLLGKLFRTCVWDNPLQVYELHSALNHKR